MDDVTGAIEQALGSPVRRRTPAPWGSKNRTTIVELTDGRRVVIQRYADRETAHARLRAAEQLAGPLNERGVPVPRPLAFDVVGPAPWAAFDELPGEPGYVAAGDDLSGANFPAIARGMGVLARRMRELDPAVFSLPRPWTDAEGLVRAGERRLADLAPYMDAADVAATHDIIRGSTTLLRDRPAVVCHGDFGPQNVLVLGDRVSGLLDLEDARIGDPLLDVAWWAWLVRAHTPVAFRGTWPGFLEAAAIDPTEPAFDERVMALIVLRLLETADDFRRSAPAKHASWAERLARTLQWRGRPLT